jgi:hypothetical protein
MHGVQGNAQLVAVDVVKHGVLLGVGLVADDRAAHAHVVQPLAAFHFDHFGPHIGQDHAGDGPGQHPAEVQDPVAVKGAAVVGLWLHVK